VTSAEISGRAMARDELAGALAGWDNEGGSVRSEANAQMVLDEVEKKILRCLGAAVIVQWNELPTEIQRRLFQHAVTMGEPPHAIRLKEEIARFLHDHKDDEVADAPVAP
jgi:hypothetical protein